MEAGFRIIEVPLNSPEPFRSIEILAKTMPDDVLIGAGTVLEPDLVNGVHDVGGKLIVMPHADIEVIKRAKDLAPDLHSRRRHADGGLRRPEGGRGRYQDIPRRSDAARRREGVARRSAEGCYRARPSAASSPTT